jgi:enoyl-CoA hydratase/carnithine racemase
MLQITKQTTHEMWTISSPGRGNGIGLTLAKLLHTAVQDSSSRLPLVITAKPLTSSKGQIWVAGGDLIELSSLSTKAEGRSYSELMSRTFHTLHESKRIIITAVDGAAIGGGAELALVGDIRLATRASIFEFKQLRAGLATGYGSARRLVDLIGLARSERLIYLCETLSADQAEALGLVHLVLPNSTDLTAKIEKICQDFTLISPEGLSAQKQMFRAAVTASSNVSRQMELDLFTSIWGNPKHQAFLNTFKGQKSPNSSGNSNDAT